MLSAVIAHHERVGGTILAEGIETEEHLEHARALGATLGQGFLFGRPGPVAHRVRTTAARVSGPRVGPMGHDGAPAPFELLASRCPVRTTRKQTLMALTRHIESQADNATDPSMVVAAVQHAKYFEGNTRRRYVDLAVSAPLIVVFGRDLTPDLGSGIRGVPLAPGDPLCTDWIVLTLGSHTAAALVARERPGQHPPLSEDDRRFDMTITYDRSLVTAAARHLLDRVP